MADASQQKELNQPHPLIVDTYLRKNYAKIFGMVFVGGVSFIIVFVNLKFAVPFFNNPLTIFLLGGGCVLVSTIFAKHIITPRIKSHINKCLSNNDGFPIEEQIEKQFSSFQPISMVIYLQEFAKILVERGHKGITIRNCPSNDITAIEPFKVTFEPLLLDESDATIAELDNPLNLDITKENSDAPTGEKLTTGMISPRLNRNIRIAGGWAVFSILFASTLLMMISSLMVGEFNVMAIIMSLFLVMIIFGIRSGSTMGNNRWLIVPGGLIVREGKSFSQDCKLHLFDRSTSVLILSKISKHHWYISAANENTFQFSTATRRESEILLRAWLSPLPPPPIEQLSDLM